MLQKFLHKTPRWIQRISPDFVWKIDTDKKELYLTFDDGPIPEVTEFVLKELNKHQAKATFFCVGENLIKHPDIGHEIVKEGHILGNHTFNHLKGWNTSNQNYIDNVIKCEEQLKDFQESKMLFRPPYGRIKPAQAKALKEHEIIMWNRLSWDFGKNLNLKRAIYHLTNSPPGSIFVFHDNMKSFKNMSVLLPELLKYYSNEGFEFKAISQ